MDKDIARLNLIFRKQERAIFKRGLCAGMLIGFILGSLALAAILSGLTP